MKSTEENQSDLKLTPEFASKGMRYFMKRLTDASMLARAVEENFQNQNDVEKAHVIAKVREGFDEALGLALRDSYALKHIVKSTKSSELFIHYFGDVLSSSQELPELLTQFEKDFAEPIDFDDDTSDSVYFRFAETVIILVKHLEKLCTTNPERFRTRARELPYWPMLVFRHKAANNHLFEKSADGQTPLAEAIELGKDCPINVSNRANYSLKTPINAFVWDLLEEIHRGRDWVKSVKSGEFQKDSSKQTDEELLIARAGMSQEEVTIYMIAYELPPLDKTTSSQWGDSVLMPLIRLLHPDLRNVSVFANLETGPNGKRYAPARKLILKALHNLAREPGAGWA